MGWTVWHRPFARHGSVALLVAALTACLPGANPMSPNADQVRAGPDAEYVEVLGQSGETLLCPDGLPALDEEPPEGSQVEPYDEEEVRAALKAQQEAVAAGRARYVKNGDQAGIIYRQPDRADFERQACERARLVPPETRARHLRQMKRP
jgi:hypothetical protein